MLKTRVITALVLLLVLLVVLFSGSFLAFALVLSVFYACAAWESARLFDRSHPLLSAALWATAFIIVLAGQLFAYTPLLFALCAAIWIIRLVPSLALGLPPVSSVGNRLVGALYGISVFGCFVAIAVLFQQGPTYLLSALTIVWIADIGAYFAGKAFGKRKLAPSISPGKSWEGAIGGWLAVLISATLLAEVDALGTTFFSRLDASWGWSGLFLAMTLLVAASVVGDLFESQLKRRIGMKDSSHLLPGHGGILDRVDALIPALPVIVLFDSWL